MPVSENTRSSKAPKDDKPDVPPQQPSEGQGGAGLPTVDDNLQEKDDGLVNQYPVDDDPQDDKDGQDFGEFGRGLKLRLPEFWGDQPETWFQQVEAVFWRYGVRTEERRYYLVVCHLPRQVAARVTDALKNPHKTKPYSSLKEHLISAFSVSQYQKDLDLVRYVPGRDERPSQVLDKMLSLIPNEEDKSKPSSLFRSMYFAKLDPQIRDHVVSMPYERFRDVAIKADEHWFARQSANIDSVATVSWADEVNEICEAPANSINALEEFCYYHRVFGKDAQNCRQPCKFKKTTSSQATGQKFSKSKNAQARRN